MRSESEVGPKRLIWSSLCIIAQHEPAIGALVAEEFREWPRPVSMAILRAWRDAVDLGLAFRLVSARPEAPVAFARRRLVQVMRAPAAGRSYSEASTTPRQTSAIEIGERGTYAHVACWSRPTLTYYEPILVMTPTAVEAHPSSVQKCQARSYNAGHCQGGRARRTR